MTNLVDNVELAPNEKRCSKCKEVKDRSEFGRNCGRKDGLLEKCKPCYNERQRYTVHKRHPIEYENGMICPVCGVAFLNLISHGIQTHGITREDLVKVVGVGNLLSPITKEKLRLSGKTPKPQLRKDTYAGIANDYITIPKRLWPLDCKFVKVKVDKIKFQIHLNPVNRELPNTKSVAIPDGKHQIKIQINTTIKAHLGLFRPVYELRKNAGLYIQFFEQDEKVLEPFEFWAKGKNCIKNTSALTTYSHYSAPKISIADHLWPLNAEYVYPEWKSSDRKNGDNYLDLIPVSRTGFIVGINKLNFKQYIGLNDCRKVLLNRKRFVVCLQKLIHENNIPSGDWDLKEILPSGALRFVLSEPKDMPKVKQPALNKPERDAKPMQAPEGTFEDWLTEIGANDDIAS